MTDPRHPFQNYGIQSEIACHRSPKRSVGNGMELEEAVLQGPFDLSIPQDHDALP